MYKEVADHKDPFNGVFKSVMIGFVFFLQLLPWMSLAPWLPYFFYL